MDKQYVTVTLGMRRIDFEYAQSDFDGGFSDGTWRLLVPGYGA